MIDLKWEILLYISKIDFLLYKFDFNPPKIPIGGMTNMCMQGDIYFILSVNLLSLSANIRSSIFFFMCLRWSKYLIFIIWQFYNKFITFTWWILFKRLGWPRNWWRLFLCHVWILIWFLWGYTELLETFGDLVLLLF